MSLVRRLAGVPLTLFIVWQVGFLFSANLLKMLDDARPSLRDDTVAERIAPEWIRGEGERYSNFKALERVPKRWGELTGQPQHWSLFAPEVVDHIPFPAVELRWDDGRAPVILTSNNEPADKRSYFRWGNFRLRRYEGNVDLILSDRDQPREILMDLWRGRIESKVRAESDSMHAYLRWRLAAYQRAHPEQPRPKEVILAVNTYRIPPPPGPDPWDWKHSDRPQPIARWRPGAEPGPEYYVLEIFNPVMNRFEPLR